MADAAEFEVIMNGVDNGVAEMTDKASDSLTAYNDRIEQAGGQSEQAADKIQKTAEQLGAEKQAADASAESNGKVGISLTQLNAGLDIATKALGYAEKGYDATIGKALTYGETIRNLSAISGQSAESTSRMVQVLDDWQVSAEDVEAATRKMTANGLVPNLDTIATLGEQYRAIQDPMEKNKFITDNLGRSGQQWNQVLGQTREQLQAASAAVNDNLVLTKKQLAELDHLRLVQDSVKDSWDSILISVGTKGAPIMANWLTMIDNATKGQGSWQERIERTNGLAIIPAIDLLIQYSDAQNQNVQALDAATQAETTKATATTTAAEAERIAKEIADARNATLTTQIALASSIQSQMDTFSTSQAAISEQQAALNVKITEAAAAYGAQSSQVVELQTQYAALGTKSTELAAQNAEAMAKIRIDNLQAKLAVDGISDADYNLIIAEQLKAGIITQAAADQSVAMNTINTQLAEHKITQDEYDKAIADGSLVVKDASDKNVVAFDDQSKAMTRQADQGKADIDAYNQKVAESATVTESATAASATSWNTWGDSIASVFDSLMQYISDYNAAVGSLQSPPPIPSGSNEINTASGYYQTEMVTII